MSEREMEFYLGNQYIYVSHYESTLRASRIPRHVERERAFAVVVPPLFEELARTRRDLVRLARELAHRGIDVVRFDYRGTGLSAGVFEEFTMEGAREQLEEVMDYCRDQGATRIHLIGARFGGYLALSNLIFSRTPCDNVVAWEPTTDLALHIEDLFREEASSQTTMFGFEKRTKAEIVANLKSSGVAMIAGYRLSMRAYQELVGSPVLRFDVLRKVSDKFQLIFSDGKTAFDPAATAKEILGDEHANA